MSAPSTPAGLRSVDRDLLLALRAGELMSVPQLTESLGVTATAVRQRIDRMLNAGLVEREKEVAGRGRPSYRYRLTVLGHKKAGANPAELADAMWREILAIPDDGLRRSLVDGVALRLGRQYADQLTSWESEGTDGTSKASFELKMRRLVGMLSVEEMDLDVHMPKGAQLPVLDIATCPYPSLTSASEDRSMCRLEEQMLSEALGTPVELSSCRLDGDSCCQFSVSEEHGDPGEVPEPS